MDQGPVQPIGPARDVVLVTKGSDSLPDGAARGLLVGTAGTANLVTEQGGVRSDVPLQQGYNPIRVLAVLTGGTADDIWAIY
ncbi:spike base protein, RCAP_Rcc01079 family [Tistlia consotensis]|nr:hypothetical protein [Tistlia consotensis]